jgi:hypothetical protein
MWSGPRTVSTALLRAWGQRPDTFVVDEPFYAHYLRETGAPHPGAAEVIAHQENDWRKVADFITGPIPEGKQVFYQKHMAHHLLPGMGRDWLKDLFHAFLIRDPGEMLLSLDAKTPHPGLEDTGLPQEVEIFDDVVKRTGRTPPVIDARDVLTDPRGILDQLCAAAGLPFLEDMLSWPPGRRATDGIWAKHWYESVENSTGFAPYRPRTGRLSPELEDLRGRCMPFYDRLHAVRLRP